MAGLISRTHMDADSGFADAVVFRGAPHKNAMWEILFLAGGALLVFESVWDTELGFFRVVLAVGIVALLWPVVRVALNIYRGWQVTVAVGPRGIYDWRLSDDWIPWTAVRSIDVASADIFFRTCRFGVTVELDGAFATSFRDKQLSRIARMLNRPLGISALTVTMAGTDGNFAKLKAALARYCPQWQQVSTDEVRK